MSFFLYSQNTLSNISTLIIFQFLHDSWKKKKNLFFSNLTGHERQGLPAQNRVKVRQKHTPCRLHLQGTSCSKSSGIVPLSKVTLFNNWTVTSCFHHATVTRTPLGCFLWTICILTEIKIAKKKEGNSDLRIPAVLLNG